ncbi:hypothetical protein F0170_05375 [Pseudomonas sp. MAFF 730085]|uniref:Uncharacterized protein n=1 Tax=Pseudomonas kitaguniensis TaxID=2607908 RepID=A0A5N7JPY5_9PSED|nr:hypothetical protein [Pseudomonas kitaguniensis]
MCTNASGRRPPFKCGRGLACDAGDSVFQLNRGDAIAGKPAPTVWSALGYCLALSLLVARALEKFPTGISGCP